MNKSNIKKIRIEIHKDKKMFVSEWIMFLGGIIFIGIVVVNIINIINSFPESEKLLALIVFFFVIIKLVHWIRIPITYSANDITQELDYYFREKKTNE